MMSSIIYGFIFSAQRLSSPVPVYRDFYVKCKELPNHGLLLNNYEKSSVSIFKPVLDNGYLLRLSIAKSIMTILSFQEILNQGLQIYEMKFLLNGNIRLADLTLDLYGAYRHISYSN